MNYPLVLKLKALFEQEEPVTTKLNSNGLFLKWIPSEKRLIVAKKAQYPDGSQHDARNKPSLHEENTILEALYTALPIPFNLDIKHNLSGQNNAGEWWHWTQFVITKAPSQPENIQAEIFSNPDIPY